MHSKKFDSYDQLVKEVEEMRETHLMIYPDIQTQPGQSGGPIFLWNYSYYAIGMIIGVHTGGDGINNYGTVFGDDFGLT